MATYCQSITMPPKANDEETPSFSLKAVWYCRALSRQSLEQHLNLYSFDAVHFAPQVHILLPPSYAMHSSPPSGIRPQHPRARNDIPPPALSALRLKKHCLQYNAHRSTNIYISGGRGVRDLRSSDADVWVENGFNSNPS